jgi:GH24 family phage-related lysozyme (muramidase)
MATFADVVKRQRKEGASRTGALASAVGQKTLEAIDPRKFLNQTGTLTALFPSLKAYQAKGAGDKSDKNLDKLATLQASGDAATKVSLEEMIVKLNDVSVYTRMSAKNTNLVKQNIGRLLKVFGETQATKADMFFKGAGEREAAIEAARKRTAVTPTKVETKKEEGGGFLSTLFAPLIAALSPLIKTITSFGGVLSSILSVGSLLSGSLGLLKVAVSALLSPLGLVVGALGGFAWWLTKKDSRQMITPDEYGNIPGGMTPDMSSVISQNADVQTSTDMVKGIKGLPQAMKETQAEQALELGRKTSPDDSYSKIERIRAERALNPTTPTQVSPNDISEDLVNFIKTKEGFREKAYWDHKQYSIGYGTKANGPDEVIDKAEADRRLREEIAKSQKFVIDHALKHGYNWDQNKIDLGPGGLLKLTNNGTRNDEEIASKMLEYNQASGKVNQALVTRRGQEFAMFTGGRAVQAAPTLASTTPTSGPKVSTASSSVSEGRMMLAAAPASTPTVIQDNSTKIQNAGQGPSVALNAWDPFMFENIVSRVS